MDYASLPHSLSDSDADSSCEQQAEDLWPFYSIGRPDDVLVPRDKTCQEISDLLGRAHTLGQFSFGAAAPTLPDAPGLALEGGCTVPLPLCAEVADRIVQRGYEECKKVWTVSPSLLRLKNPAWTVGFPSVLELSSRRLGFDGVTLQAELSKLMVVGAGGRIDTVQDAENARSVATLVVQLPSEYFGGDWVVHEEETRKDFRYDMGKADGAAAFKPHLLAFCAGASNAMEEVTSGYCVMLVYSLCLPVGVALADRRQDRSSVRTQLGEALRKLKGGPDDAELSGDMEDTGSDEPAAEQASVILALVLSKDCNQTNIETAGINSLSGVDWDRLQLLRAANERLPPGKQLVFYLARIRHEVRASSEFEQKRVYQSESWFFTSGAKINSDSRHVVEWTTTFNFLNPGNETLSELWGGERNDYNVHERFALVGWPASTDIGNALTLFGELPSIPVILAHQFISVATLQRLLDLGDGRSGYSGFAHAIKAFELCRSPVSLLALCHKLGEIIIALGDVELAQGLFRKYVVHLKEKERSQFIQWLPKLVQKFGWENLRASILGAIDVKSVETRLNLALELADMLTDDGASRSDLAVFAVGKAKSWCLTRPEAFVSSGTLIKLVKRVMSYENTQVLSVLVSLLQNLSGKLLRPVIDALLASLGNSSSPEHCIALVSVATRRRQWLVKEIEDSKNPFTWSIPVKDFSGVTAIEQFLQGADDLYEIRGFTCIAEARTRVHLLRQKIQGSIQFVAGGRGRDAFVQIIKAGGDFDARRKEVPAYEAEIERLDQLVKNLSPDDENLNTANTSSSGSSSKGTLVQKRPREEESDIVAFE